MCPNCLLKLGLASVPAPTEPEPATVVHKSAGSGLAEAPERPAAEQAGARIGRYKLLEPIGEGGFGTVWMAEQTEPVRRKVALKIIKLGMDTREVVARFEAERQALALMNHPNIARVFDGGTTESGRPYFVMELVKGVRITEYCDTQRLSTEQRLKLVIEVCQAVQHAHQKGVIHRDLKPNNVLVTEQDGKAVPKVIDFGIAKATGTELTDKTLFTRFNQVIGTPAYMSPEQAGLGKLDVDTRSDIYALGVLLYELLTGRTPFSNEDLLKAGLDEVLRTIREKEPPKPSTRLGTLSQGDLQAAAASRAVPAARLSRLVRGELDWIVMKCLEKDRARRYETANGLARDLERHLNNEPVVAGPPSALYRVQKAIRRNQLAVTAAAVISTVLIAGIFASTWQANRAKSAEREQVRLRREAERERTRAQTAATRSDEVATFLKDMLKSAGPSVAGGRDSALLREILEKAATRAKAELSNQPAVQGDILMTIGSTFTDIGDRDQAIPLLQDAIPALRSAYGENSAQVALALGRLGSALSFRRQVEKGRSNAWAGLNIARSVGDPDVLTTCLISYGTSLHHSGAVPPEAVPYFREALAIQRNLKTNLDGIILCLRNLSVTVTNDAEGEALAREGLALARSRYGETNTMTAGFHFALGQELLKEEKLAEASEEFRRTLGLWRILYDWKHPYRDNILRFLLYSLIRQDRWQEAEDEIMADMRSSPANSYCWSYRATLDLCRRRWPMVTTNLLPATDENDRYGLYSLGIARLAAGQRAQYLGESKTLLKWVATVRAPDFATAEQISVLATLIQPEPADLELAARLSERASEWPILNAVPWGWRARAMTELRRGRFASAVEWADKALKALGPETWRMPGASGEEAWRENKLACRANALFVRALALGHMGRLDAARETLNEGEHTVHLLDKEYMWVNWLSRDWVIADLLRREARSLLPDRPAKAK
jgi:serine/threonine protein kinase